jgi:hypothetical protein
MLRLLKKTLVMSVGVMTLYVAEATTQTVTPASPKQKPAAKAVMQKTKPVQPDSAAAAKRSPAADSTKHKADSSVSRDSAALQPRTLDVITDPPGAHVFLDDSLKGESPCTITGIASGAHILTIKKKGFYLKKAEITADSTLPRELAYALLQPGTLKILSNPAGADVMLDGKKEGITPYENDKVKPGDHIVNLTLQQYTPYEKSIKTGSGTHDTLQINLDHTVAFKDSVAAAIRSADKVRKDRNTLGLVSGIFGLFVLVLVFFEIASQ